MEILLAILAGLGCIAMMGSRWSCCRESVGGSAEAPESGGWSVGFAVRA
jgi:hypothetical protein